MQIAQTEARDLCGAHQESLTHDSLGSLEEMTASISVGHNGMDWPGPVHHIDGRVVPSLLLTVPEACAELRVSRAQLYVMANKQHVIEMVHIGKLCRIPRASVESYVERLRYQASPRVAPGGLALGDREGAR